ncbi:ACT domain-containing protein [Candidatus Bathyarchaeota archaeon]|jgi:hypothetical protein|nr:ACT domain-containing protein [Candidatus Bathyarchaeota archaeon]MBT4320448.1 ACT domain-containing protein [Candidatus Bathyarchaeota archaeon]MBT5641531.1 ACT domain-containing protein [Candidatus Bathyarchaeota archaeon]MBT6604898.1 ACT domain-containing protein [Candidatus Bathyarchaeota archaeon]MBT7185942.1 ACT domain-containing protein [Candidatus Bathyarchaeota archaeon]
MSDILPSVEMMTVFASTKIHLHPDEFILASLPLSEKELALDAFKSLEPFSSVTVDHAEVSLILRSSDWDSMKHLFESSDAEGPYSAITFDIVLDLSLVGFLSVVSAVLAEAGISIYALSTYLRDHIFVQSSHADEAVRKLDELIMRCRDQKLL